MKIEINPKPNTIMHPLTCLFILLLILLAGCSSDKQTDSSSPDQSPSSVAYQQSLQKIEQLKLEGTAITQTTWDDVLKEQLPASTYVTNNLRSDPETTPADSLRLPSPASLKVGMPWLLNGELTAFFVAEHNGYYEAVNLKVELVPGGPGVDHLLGLQAGLVDIAMVADPIRFLNMLTSSTGSATTLIGALYSRTPLCFIGLDNTIPQEQYSTRPVNIKEFPGTRIGLHPGADHFVDLFAFRNQWPEGTIKKLRLGSSLAPVIAQKMEWGMGWVSSQAQELERMGYKNWRAFSFWQNGFDISADVIVVRNEQITKDAAILRAFLWATAKGKRFHMHNHQASAKIANALMPAESVISEAHLLRRYELERPYYESPKNKDPLYTNIENWHNALVQLSEAGLLE